MRRTPAPRRRGASIVFAMLAIAVVGAAAAALQTRTAAVVRDARTARQRIEARLEAESRIERLRDSMRTCRPYPDVPSGRYEFVTNLDVKFNSDGTYSESARIRTRDASVHLRVRLRPVLGRLPRIVEWSE